MCGQFNSNINVSAKKKHISFNIFLNEKINRLAWYRSNDSF